MAKKPTYEKLEQRIERLEKEALEHERVKEALLKQTHDLSERVKELNCLYSISDLIEKQDISSEEILQGTVNIIPLSWQYPEIACARIILEDQEFRTENFKETTWKQASDIVVHGERIGSVEVFYLEERPESDEGPFFKEERSLINGIAGRLGRIIEWKRAEDALRESNEKFRHITASAKDAIIMMNDEGNISYWNEGAEEIFGYSTQEVLGKELHTLLAPRQYHDAYKKGIRTFKTTGHGTAVGKTLGLEAVKKDGTIFPMELSLSAVKVKKKWHAIGILRDITARKQAEEALQKAHDELEHRVRDRTAELTEANEQLKLRIEERKGAEEALRDSEERYRRITDAVTDYIFTVRIENGHPAETVHGLACVAVTGYTSEEYASDPYLWFRMVHKEDRTAVQEQAKRVLSEQEVRPVEHRILRKDGVIRWVRNTFVPHYDTEGKLLSYDGLVSDIHERKEAEEAKTKLEARLRQAQKMEAIGTMAGGIAHDFNNILAIILGNTDLALYDGSKRNPLRKNLEEIRQACLRAKNVVSQILTFSRQTEQERKPLQLNSIIKESLRFLRASLPANIEIRRNIKRESGTVLADPTQIHQVLINLCTNAAHAMRKKGGVLEVRLVDVNPAGHSDLPPGPYVKLAVSDTGDGIEPEIIDRIFDPYFTTKAVGEGTGLGLAVIHGIVESHNGMVTVHSENGKGTTFNVFFPRIETEATPKTETSGESIPGGNERILVVDDEETIVNVIKMMLERLDYEVVARANSAEALEVFRIQPDRFDLVITDQTMPHMTGEMLTKELRNIRSDIPIILCTGYSELITEEKAKAMGIQEFVMKPIDMRDLAVIIRKVLDKSRSESF